jgi:hypothetical protein
LLLYAQNLYVCRFDELLIEWKIMKLLGYCFLVLFKRKTKYWNLGDEKRWSLMENCGITQGWF